MSAARYCQACKRTEVSKCNWHGADGLYFCHGVYKRLLYRYPDGIAHPSWEKMERPRERDRERETENEKEGKRDGEIERERERE